MSSPAFRVGIDLGTTNCALAWVAAGDPEGRPTVLAVPQAATQHSRGSWPTLPSCLYRPPGAPAGEWSLGRWARDRAVDVPGRVVRSAKSWLGHHAVDRRSRFLPFGSEDLAPDERLSPVEAQARLLAGLAAAWDTAHPEAPLARQDVAVTVPASFDPLAQHLTLEAARLAGLPEDTLLLEEPQAAFYAWLETATRGGVDATGLLRPDGGETRVLVVDLGGGTSDFSLFTVARDADGGPRLRRVAVSEHLLLGGDNLDLALAHYAESLLSPGSELPASTFAQLLARCREIKEEALGEGAARATDRWPVAVVRPGASLLGGTLRAELDGEAVRNGLLDGFFPGVGAEEKPLRTASGLREIGLPYARDPAVTRHLAAFLRGLPPVDYLLCNGGLTKAPAVRERLLANLTRWQAGRAPTLLGSTDPDLAVAVGAARFLHLRAGGDRRRIEAGAAHACYLGTADGRAICVLPLDTPPEQPVTTDVPGLRALIGKPARFPLFQHRRRSADRAGDLVDTQAEGFQELPPIEARLTVPSGGRSPRDPRVPVRLRARLRSTGILRVELLCAEPEPGWPSSWPLDFATRAQEPAASPTASSGGTKSAGAPSGENALPSLAGAGAEALVRRFRAGTTGKERLTASAVFAAGEKAVGAARATWNAALVRALFDAWVELAPRRGASADHEETWLHVAGYLLRPGRGFPGDTERIDRLWEALGSPTLTTNKSGPRLQRWLCARRTAAGIGRARAEALWKQAAADWPPGGVPPGEVALLAGALEVLPREEREAVVARTIGGLLHRPQETAFWRALGRLLSRVLVQEGPEQVLPPEQVEAAWRTLAEIDVPAAAQAEAAAAWLRAARRTGARPLDVSSSCRSAIDRLLDRWRIPESRRVVLHEVLPVATADTAAAFGESLPGGLTLSPVLANRSARLGDA